MIGIFSTCVSIALTALTSYTVLPVPCDRSHERFNFDNIIVDCIISIICFCVERLRTFSMLFVCTLQILRWIIQVVHYYYAACITLLGWDAYDPVRYARFLFGVRNFVSWMCFKIRQNFIYSSFIQFSIATQFLNTRIITYMHRIMLTSAKLWVSNIIIIIIKHHHHYDCN